MTFKVHLFSLILSLFSFLFASAQDFTSNAEATFEVTSHDFGVVKQESNEASYAFKVKNTGTNPLIIYNVKPSCGCTSTTWTKEPIPVGKEGEVTAVYSTHGSLGKFHKTLNVMSNGKHSPITLTIVGEVTTDIPEVVRLYHFPLGKSLGMKKPLLNFGRVTKLEKKRIGWEVASFSNQKQTLQLLDAPSYLSIISPITHAPSHEITIDSNKEVTIELICDMAKIDHWGATEMFLHFLNGVDTLTLPLFVDIHDDTTAWKGKQNQAPNIAIDTVLFDCGNRNQKEVIPVHFTLKNTGQSDLIIRRIYPSSKRLTIITPENLVIKPNDTKDIDGQYIAGTRIGKQYYFINLLTNSPANQNVKLIITSYIKP